jgi:glutathione gamma-glutamylcysteinyltransferase
MFANPLLRIFHCVVISSSRLATSSLALAPSSMGPVSKSFYQRPLPASCAAFSSPRGKTFFASAMAHGGLKTFFSLIEQHSTQTEPAYCGLSTLVVVLNALAVDPRQVWKGPWRWYEESMLNCCLDLDQVKTAGVTLPQFHCLASCQGLVAELQYADDQETSGSLECFRTAVRSACVEATSETTADTAETINSMEDGDPLTILVVSYSRAIIGQTGSGHFSPLAAYDEASDQVLILDTARFKYGAHWVPLQLLYQAMQPVDSDTGRSRGYLLLTAPVETTDMPLDKSCCDDKCSTHSESSQCRKSNLPQAILLWSPMKQRAARQQFKAHLQELDSSEEPTLEQVMRFCTNDRQDFNFVWKMTQVQLIPCTDDYESKEHVAFTMALIDHMRAILDQLLKEHFVSHDDDPLLALFRPPPEINGIDKSATCHYHCRSNYSRSLSMKAPQVIFLVYLAALPESRRREIVFGDHFDSQQQEGEDGEDPTLDWLARRQLLVEAQLLRAAIDVSDSNVM